MKRSPVMTCASGILLLGIVGSGGCSQDPETPSAAAKARATDANTRSDPALPPGDANVVMVEDEQLRRIKVEPVRVEAFRVEKSATGRIAFNEDASTPVFSPYTGRVVRLLAKPGDDVKRGSSLFEIDTPDLVQAQTDLISAHAALIKARNTLDLARRTAARQDDLYQAKAVSQKDWEQAQSDLRNAESDLRAAEGVHAGARDRLRVLGKTDDEITTIEERRQIDRLTRVFSPIAGTVTARKVGPGQYVKPDNPDPLFTIADLSTMWLLANVYEADIPLIRVGQQLEVRVLAYPKEVFRARIAYIGASADPATHRIAVRAEVVNHGLKLKPEMFASFRIVTDEAVQAPAVPVSAVVREGDMPTVWVEVGSRRFSRRAIALGLEQDGAVQVLSGVRADERVVATGAIFLSNVGR